MTRPELQLHAAGDRPAREVDAQQFDARRIGDERVPAVARADGVTRLLEAGDLMPNAELVDDADRADDRVCDNRDTADALDASRARLRRDPVEHDAGAQVDDRHA